MKEKLKQQIIEEGQFPFKRRKYQYQSIDEEEMIGIRNMKHRFSILKLPDSFENKTVLDIGCNLGMICVETMKRKAKSSIGIDHREETVNIANKYFIEKKYKNIKLITYDINNGLDELINLIGHKQFNYVFALSIWKHVDKKHLYNIINYYCKEKCWFEGHAKQTKDFFQKELSSKLNFSKINFIGTTSDRGQRANFLLTK